MVVGSLLNTMHLTVIVVSHQVCAHVQFLWTTFLSGDESYLPLVSFSLGFGVLSDVPIQDLCLSPCKCQSGLISFPQQIPVTPSRTISKSSCDLSLAVGCSPGPSGTWHHTKVTFLSVGLWLSCDKRGNHFTFCFPPLLNNMLYIYISVSIPAPEML